MLENPRHKVLRNESRNSSPVVALESVLHYTQPSQLVQENGRAHLFLATSQPELAWFFQGRLLSARRTADQLLALSRVVASRFHTPAAMLARILREADPIITCGLDRMRWEGFSACCSTYARIDLRPQALEGALITQGTTNVDFGPELRAQLTSLRDGQDCALSVGRQGMQMGPILEKKVKLPLRWLKGLAESQVVLSRMALRFDIPAAEARRFLTSLPRTTGSGSFQVAPAGRGLRLSQVPSRDSFPVAGVQRLRLLESIARHVQGLRVYEADGSSNWEVITADSSFHLTLSPDVWRGFSGEGQLLETLALSAEAPGTELGWQAVLDEQLLCRQSGLDRQQVRQALARQASAGRVGYDLAQGGYFRRNLPYDYSLVEELHPRLAAARKLSVRREGEVDWVLSGDLEYRVQEDRCTCPWYAKHSNQRGPCKHILAAQLSREGE